MLLSGYSLPAPRVVYDPRRAFLGCLSLWLSLLNFEMFCTSPPRCASSPFRWGMFSSRFPVEPVPSATAAELLILKSCLFLHADPWTSLSWSDTHVTPSSSSEHRRGGGGSPWFPPQAPLGWRVDRGGGKGASVISAMPCTQLPPGEDWVEKGDGVLWAGHIGRGQSFCSMG